MPHVHIVPRARRRSPRQVIVYATKTSDETEIACSQCGVRVIIPAELLDVVAEEDFICPKCEGEEES